MITPPLRRTLSRSASILAFSAALAIPTLQVRAQSFAVGAGGSLVNDAGTAANVRAFGTYGGHLFGEIELERSVVLQLRVSRFGLPGTASNSPNLLVDAGIVSVSYLFGESWFRAGFFAGGGVYRLTPKDREEGQIEHDSRETSFGWHGGLLTIFDLARNWDARLEASGHLLRTNANHTPIFLTGSVAFHF